MSPHRPSGHVLPWPHSPGSQTRRYRAQIPSDLLLPRLCPCFLEPQRVRACPWARGRGESWMVLQPSLSHPVSAPSSPPTAALLSCLRNPPFFQGSQEATCPCYFQVHKAQRQFKKFRFWYIICFYLVIHLFKVYSSMNSDKHKWLCKHHYNPDIELSHPKMLPRVPENHPLPPIPGSGSNWFLLCGCRFVFSRILSKWHHKEYRVWLLQLNLFHFPFPFHFLSSSPFLLFPPSPPPSPVPPPPAPPPLSYSYSCASTPSCWILLLFSDAPLFIHSLDTVHVGCHQILAIISQVTVNIVHWFPCGHTSSFKCILI